MIDESDCPNNSYSTVLFDRKHFPDGYESYKAFKPWLRDEFWFRCVYCLTREMWYPNGQRAFSVDHVDPQSKAPEKILSYPNLAYSCLWCNSAKQDVAFKNPVEEPIGNHLAVKDTGLVEPCTEYGQILEKVLFLNEPERIASRRRGLLLSRLVERNPEDKIIQEKYKSWFGFPERLPNLEILRPPNGNRNEGSEFLSVLARQSRGELLDIY